MPVKNYVRALAALALFASTACEKTGGALLPGTTTASQTKSTSSATSPGQTLTDPDGIDGIGSDITDPGSVEMPKPNTRRRPKEVLQEDKHPATAPRPPRILDPKIHGRDTRYPLFADQPQPQERNGNSVATSVIAKLPVKNGQIDLNTVPAQHREATKRTWERVRYLLPPKHFAKIVNFEAWSGDSGASVWGRFGTVTLGLTVHAVGNNDHTIIHEFGHQLSSLPDQAQGPNGLYYRFVERFHKHPVHIPAGVSKEFYEHFVTGYAASNEDEDFAELFRYFVYLDKPTRSDKVVDQKLLLLWSHPLYTEARAHIRKQLGI